jgi:hypothetical protein
MPVKPGPPPPRTPAPSSTWQPFASSNVRETLSARPADDRGIGRGHPVRLIGAGLAAEVCALPARVRRTARWPPRLKRWSSSGRRYLRMPVQVRRCRVGLIVGSRESPSPMPPDRVAAFWAQASLDGPGSASVAVTQVLSMVAHLFPSPTRPNRGAYERLMWTVPVGRRSLSPATAQTYVTELLRQPFPATVCSPAVNFYPGLRVVSTAVRPCLARTLRTERRRCGPAAVTRE